MMSNLSREHLVEGFISELKDYIRLIRNDLDVLKQDMSKDQNLEQIYRLFHNIKGAAAQLSLMHLSDTARIIEDLLEVLLEDVEGLDIETIRFIDLTAERIQEHCLSSLKEEEAGLSLLLETITGLRNLTDDTVRENDETVKSDMVRLKNGESIVGKERLGDEDPSDYLKRCMTLLNTVGEIVQKDNSSRRISFLLEKLLKLIANIVCHEKLSDCKDITRCAESLYDLIDWFMLQEHALESNIVDLLEDYLQFVKLLVENPEFAEAKKVDHVVETMDHVRLLSESPADLQKEEVSSLQDFSIDTFEQDDDDDTFVLDEDILDSDQQYVEHLGDTEEDHFLIDEDEDEDEDEKFEQDEDGALHDIFLMECEEHLLVIGRSLVSLEQQVTEYCQIEGTVEQSLGDMRRAIHTLKGAAGMTGFMELSTFAHHGEDLLDVIFESGDGVGLNDVAVLSDFVEILELMSRQPDSVDDSRVALAVSAIEGALAVRGDRQEIDLEEEDRSQSLPDILEASELVEDDEDFSVEDDFIPEIEEETEEIDEDGDLYDIFLAECEEHLLVISRSLSVLEQHVDTPQKPVGVVEQSLGDLRRAVHTLKGAAGMTGFMPLASFAHQSEDLLDAIFESEGEITPGDVSVLADAVDMIEVMSLRPDTAEDHKISEISAAISRALAQHSADHDEPDGMIVEPPQEEAVQVEAENSVPVGPAETQILPGDTAGVRVRLENLDELVSLESELIVGRSAMEQGLDELRQTVVELNTAKERLRRISSELETGFEVESLYGFGSETDVNDDGQKTGQRDSEFADFDPIELDRYSQLSLIIRSLNEISVDVGSIHADMSGVSSELRGHMARQQMLMGVMQDKLMRVRMTPMSSISRSFFRTVRGAAERLGKQVRLWVEGEDVYLDRYIWTRIADPIMHILRNAVDHGIESDEDRLEKGKPSQATVRIAASQKGSHVVLTISDDGRGIDFTAIRNKLVRDNLVKNAEALSDEDLVEYLFVSGFSTRGQVSQISGRGVGLDVVRQNIQELRGTVRIRPHESGGTEFELRIPVTLALNRAIIVRLGGDQFAVPLHDILEIRKVPSDDITGTDKPVVKIGEKEMAFHNLPALIGVSRGTIDDLLALGNTTVLIVPGEKENEALAVDTIVEQQEIIVKDLGSHLKYVYGISGATIMGDGTLVPILNIPELIISERKIRIDEGQVASTGRVDKPLKVMIVDDSVSVRQSVSRLIKSKGWQSSLATDGVDAVEKIDSIMPDLIVLDIEMPRMNGFEFMGVLNSSDQYKDIPVIMLTSRISDKHRVKAEELGVSHYLSKPYQEDEFIGLVKESTGR